MSGLLYVIGGILSGSLILKNFRFQPNKLLVWGLIGFAVAFLLSPLNPVSPLSSTPPFDIQLMRLGIGNAEGNLTLTGEETNLYYGHTDPGNGVRNFGYCSNQRRTPGVEGADESCDRYILQFKGRAIASLKQAGIDLNDTEALLNTLDLANQANPRTFARFPYQLALARKQGLTGIEAITTARVESFGIGGREATGLIGICHRERRPVTDTECVAHDQRRRATAIRAVLKQQT